MAGVPHPQGAEFGEIYPTPEAALADPDAEPVFVIPTGLFLEHLTDPRTKAFLKHLDALEAEAPMTLQEFDEQFGPSGETA